jgi:hypothetical protein
MIRQGPRPIRIMDRVLGGNRMRCVAWTTLALLLAGCGGSPAPISLSVACSGGTKLVGAVSIEVPGDLANGRPVMEFPDPANPGRTGVIAVPPHDHCKITATNPSR